MPWKNGYTISDEKSMADHSIRWPNGARCCVRIVVNLSLANSAEGVRPDDLRTSDAFFAMHEGLDTLLAALERHCFRATFAVPAVVARAYPKPMRKILAAGHELAAQGLRHEDVSTLAPDEERQRLAETTRILADVIGQRPLGWFALPRPGDRFAVGTISEATMDLLIDAGYDYMGNSPADDIPHYWVTDFERRRAILALPYYYHFDDQFFMMFPRHGSGLENPDFLARNRMAEFAAQYRRGRMFEMTLHPQNSAWLHRLRDLDLLLAHLRGFPDLWAATSAQCAACWRETYPAETSLHLEPSIWQDHAGSLS
jgi:peptidoglycan/xylan/chitin deacetylase (PgdA/CDA1 family)